MKKLRKFFSVVLCLALIFSLQGFAFAKSGSTEQTDSYVAKVNGLYYDTLSEAINAVEEEGTVELVADAVLDKKITIETGKNITLDLGTYIIKSDGRFFDGDSMLFENNGSFTITGNGRIDAKDGANPYICIENKSGGQLNILSGNIIASKNGIRNLGGTLNILGGTIANTSTAADGEDSAVYAAKGSATVIAGNAKLSGFNTALRAYGADVTVSENAYLSGKFGVMIFNDEADNIESAVPSQLTMTGGTIEASYGFALSGNNTMSALCSAEITGGTLKSIDDGTAIYWPMEGKLTVGGNAVVTGGTGIEAKMGTITIQENATVIGTGAYLEDAPAGGGAQAEGSAILASAQMYGNNQGQYIVSPDLTVNITGGTLKGTLGNAVTVYNTEAVEAQKAEVNVTGGVLNAAEDKAGVKVIMESGNNDTDLVSGTESNSFITSGSQTTVTVSSKAAVAAVDQNRQTSFYTDVNDALNANAPTSDTPVNIYVLGDSQISSEALKSQNIKLTTANGVELTVNSGVSGMIVQETTNPDGSKTYELVDASELAAPRVSVSSDKNYVHTGDTITLTAKAEHEEQGVTYSYEWYKDGEVIEGQNADTLKVTEGGIYTVKVTAHKEDQNVILTSETTESPGIKCTVESHKYEGEWQNDGTSHWQECICGEKGNMADHKFGKWIITKEATADEQGSREKVCEVCGYTVTEVIPATGTTGTNGSGDQVTSDDIVKTGDESNIILWAMIMMFAAVCAAGCTVYNKKRN